MYYRGSLWADTVRDAMKTEPCPVCKGSGYHTTDPRFDPIWCDECNGTGIKGDPGLGARIVFIGGLLFWVIVLAIWRWAK